MLRMVGLGTNAARRVETTDQLPLTTSCRAGHAREDLNEAKRLAPYVNTISAVSKSSP
jgi:hypothetical protein